MRIKEIKNKDMIFVVISIIIIIILLNYDAIKSELNNPRSMQIRETYFNDETKRVLNIFKNEIKFFEYKTNKKVKAVKVDFWQNNGENWENFGTIYNNINKGKFDIALNTSSNFYKLYSLNDKTIIPYEYESIVKFNKNLENISTNFLENSAKIKINEEIVLFSKYGFQKSIIGRLANYKELEQYKAKILPLESDKNTKDFRDVKCKKGVAITITFLDEEIQ